MKPSEFKELCEIADIIVARAVLHADVIHNLDMPIDIEIFPNFEEIYIATGTSNLVIPIGVIITPKEIQKNNISIKNVELTIYLTISVGTMTATHRKSNTER